MKKINKVAIVGGTHGNELTGVYTLYYFLKNKELIRRTSFSSDCFLANEEAVKLSRRYKDIDLNRSFSLGDLKNNNLKAYENIRARELNEMIGPKDGHARYDFMIDMHSSTANMGVTIIITDNDPLSFYIAHKLQGVMPDVRVLIYLQDRMEQAYITSLVPHALTIEMGVIPQGVLFADMFYKMKKVVMSILDIIDKHNENHSENIKGELTVFEGLATLDYPKDENGEIIAMVHPNIQNKDYCKICKGDALFIDFDGNEILYDGAYGDEVYPVFINEAAYYEKGIALYLTRKRTFKYGV